MSILFLYLYLLFQISSGEKIIINTDAGSDDAIAILLLLRYEALKPPSSTFEIIGITCTFGNTREENVENNILATLAIAGREDIPVYTGAKKGYIEPFSTDNHFGVDGFGNNNFNGQLYGKIDRSKHAAIALMDMVNQNAGNISIVSLGPLTNIALAISLDYDLPKKVNQFYVMGGSIAGIGVIRPNVEFNFAADPESNVVLFNSTERSKITLVPWEPVITGALKKSWRVSDFGKLNSPYVKFINKIERVNLFSDTQWGSADTVLAACIIEPELISSYVVKNVKAVTGGEARGSILVDYTNLTDRIENTKIIQAINKDEYKKLLIKYFSCKTISC